MKPYAAAAALLLAGALPAAAADEGKEDRWAVSPVEDPRTRSPSGWRDAPASREAPRAMELERFGRGYSQPGAAMPGSSTGGADASATRPRFWWFWPLGALGAAGALTWRHRRRSRI